MNRSTRPLNLKFWAATVLALAIVIAGVGLATSNAEWARLSNEFGVGGESRTFSSLQEPPSIAELHTHCEQAVVEYLERQDQISDSTAREYLDRWRSETGFTKDSQPAGRSSRSLNRSGSGNERPSAEAASSLGTIQRAVRPVG